MTLPGWRYPRVIAHRGGGVVAPENTLAGMQAARLQGFPGVEFDVMLAADGVPILMHDVRFGRTVAGSGSVATTTSQVLGTMDAGSWLSPRFAGEPVPLFIDVMRWLDAHGIWMNVEIKPAPGHDAATGEQVARFVRLFLEARDSAADACAPPLLSSFSRVALAAARKAAPDVARALIVKRVPVGWQRQLATLGCVALHCDHRYLDLHVVQRIRAAGYGLMCYTVNDPLRARELFRWGVDAVCTDRIDIPPGDFRQKSAMP